MRVRFGPSDNVWVSTAGPQPGGYTASWTSGSSDLCTLCQPGTYKYGRQCTTCPGGTTSVLGSLDLADSKCSAGYTAKRDGIVCTVCPAGTYKPPGVGPCSPCPAGTSSALGSKKLTDCTCLPEPEGMADGKVCKRCAAHKLKATTGVGMCNTCPRGAHLLMSNSDKVCVCLPGYTATENDVVCTACEVGTYKVETGIGECYICPSGTTTAAIWSTVSTDCKGLPGYSGDSDGVVCSACTTGMFKESLGTGTC